ncbi:MAG: hypothetical protein LBV13_06435 [Methanomassiliicoccaceae archaeon]|jgi:RNase P/RNase MRP subunit POP5|nr:hypothetical protein [Methanomassiliicoccaceae archaeon]
MTVKEKVGRRRYIAFTVDPSFTKGSLISALRNSPGEPPYVIQCAEGWCIVRCPLKDVDDAIRAVRGADGSSVPLRTSGTLSALRDKYPELKRLRPARKM